MRARTCESPVENPEEEDEAETKPAMKREFVFFACDVFDLRIGRHTPSVHAE